MKDGHLAFRTSVWSAIDGNLTATFGGLSGAVPVYDDEVRDKGQNLYVIMSTQSGADETNRSNFNTDPATLELQICHKSDRAVDKRYLDDIAGQIIEILWPDAGGDGLVQQANFQIHSLRKQSDSYLPLQISSTQSLMRRIITLKARVHQL